MICFWCLPVWCGFTLPWCMSSYEPNLFSTFPIPHSLSCVVCQTHPTAFTFALFYTNKCDVSQWVYNIVFSAIVTFFLFVCFTFTSNYEGTFDHHNVCCPARTSAGCVHVISKNKLITKENKGQFFTKCFNCGRDHCVWGMSNLELTERWGSLLCMVTSPCWQ